MTADLSSIFILYVMHEGCFVPFNLLELEVRLFLTVVVIGIPTNYKV